mgnify:CR=1 FL=1
MGTVITARRSPRGRIKNSGAGAPGSARATVKHLPLRLHLHSLRPGEHRLEVEVLNTRANLVCGTPEQTHRLEQSGVFTGTYSPLVMPRDQQRILSVLPGPVRLISVT